MEHNNIQCFSISDWLTLHFDGSSLLEYHNGYYVGVCGWVDNYMYIFVAHEYGTC